MKNLIAALLVFAALPTHADETYWIDWRITALPGTCGAYDRLDPEGGPFFDVNSLPIPTYTTDRDPNNPPSWLNADAKFTSTFLKPGPNEFKFEYYHGTTGCAHDYNLVLLKRYNGSALPLFELENEGDHVVGLTTRTLDLREILPTIADDISKAKDAIAREQVKILNESTSALVAAKQLDRLVELENALDHLLHNGFEGLTLESLDALLSQYSDIGGEIKAALDTLYTDLKKELGVYRNEIKQLVDTFRDQMNSVTGGLVTDGAQANGFDPNDAGNYQPTADPSKVPDVPVPQLAPDPFDVSHDPYAVYAEQIITQLRATTLADGSVDDRTTFQSVVRGWHTNQAIIEQALKLRSGVSQKEWGAFLNAQNRVTNWVRQYMDGSDWFKDAPVPQQLKDLVDLLMVARMANQARALKGNLNLWVGPKPSVRQQLVIDTLVAILDGALRSEDYGSEDEDIRVLEITSKMVDGAVLAAKQEAAKLGVYFTPWVGGFAIMCEVATGSELCRSQGKPVSLGFRVFNGVTTIAGSKIFWASVGKALPAAKAVGVSMGMLLPPLGDLGQAERAALLGRLSPASITEVAGLTGKELQLLLDSLRDPLIGDRIVNELAAALKGSGLKELNALKMAWTLDSRAAALLSAGKGAAARALPPLKGKGIDAIRTVLKNAGFKYYPVTNGGQEIWMHSDNSLVRISGSGGTKVRPYYHFKKEISDTFEAYAPGNVVAKVTDSGAVVPESIGKGCGPDLTAWFQSKVGRTPSSAGNGAVDETLALGSAWGIATHIPVNP
jgi:hypothetical protein